MDTGRSANCRKSGWQDAAECRNAGLCSCSAAHEVLTGALPLRQCHITASSRQKWERYSAMLAAAQQQVAPGACAHLVSSDAMPDTAQRSVPMAGNGTASRQAEEGPGPAKRARTAQRDTSGTLPRRRSSVSSSSRGLSAATVHGSTGARSPSTAAAAQLQTLAAEQLDGTVRPGEHGESSWPPDMHDTVGCVVVDGRGALPNCVYVMTSVSDHYALGDQAWPLTWYLCTSWLVFYNHDVNRFVRPLIPLRSASQVLRFGGCRCDCVRCLIGRHRHEDKRPRGGGGHVWRRLLGRQR